MSLDAETFIRELAYQDAITQTRSRVNSKVEFEKKVILKKKTSRSMDGIKKHIKAASGKGSMRTVSHFLCDCCDKTILKPEDGFIIQGNVYAADPSCRGGLIGCAFPAAEDGTIHVDDIKEKVFCSLCLLSALGLNNTLTRGKYDKPLADEGPF